MLALLLSLVTASAQTADNPLLFTMGQIEVFTRQAGTTDVTIRDLSTGAVWATPSLSGEGARFSATSGVPRYVEVSATRPVTLFTGKALPGSNDWASVTNSDNNTELGYVHHAFTERHLWVVMAREAGDPAGSSVSILDGHEGDDSASLTRADAVIDNGSVELYYRTGFENDPITVTCSRPCMVQVASSSPWDTPTTGWGFTPPSLASGESGSEFGTHFAFYANPDVTIWPFTDGTVVEIVDLSDGDDSRTVTLNANQFFTARNLAGVHRGERAVVHAGGNLFDKDYVQVRASHPVLVYVGPNYDPGGGFTLDFAPTVPTGPGVHEAFVFANQRGIDLLSYSNTAVVTLKTVTGDATHDLSVGPGQWSGVGPYYAQPASNWARELVHVVSTEPIVIFSGDYADSYFGGCCSASFVPVVSEATELLPVARAGAEILACPFDTVAFDGSASFDADALGDPPSIAAYAWDFDTAVNSDGVGGPDDDVDATGPSALHTYPANGTYGVRLTVTDNDGQEDDDFLNVTIDVAQLALCGGDADGDGVGAFNDNCPLDPNPTQADLDGDGLGDACDPDDDNDGVVDLADNCPLAVNPGQDDTDADGPGDACDVCPDVFDPAQADLDGDGDGDACDPDDDGDGVDDGPDNCPAAANPDQRDTDLDGIGDACDDDLDGDGTLNASDNCTGVANASQEDVDGDGFGDACVHPSAIVDPSVVHFGTYIGAKATVGAGTTLGFGAIVGRRSEIGANSALGEGVVVARAVSVGEGAQLGDGVAIGYAAQLGDDVVLGEGVGVGNLAQLSTGTWLGAGVSVGRGCQLLQGPRVDRDAGLGPACVVTGGAPGLTVGADARILRNGRMLQASTLGAAAALGRNSVVCVATRIGTGAVVRADNYVCADVPAGDVVGRGRYPLP